MEQAAQMSGAIIQHLFKNMGALSKAFYDKYGNEALPVITNVMSSGGTESGKIVQRMLPATNMKSLVEMFNMMGAMMGMGMEVVESSDDTFHFKVSRCPYDIEGTNKGLCEALMTSDAKLFSTAMGQDVEMKILKSVAVGDKECDIVFSIK
jgi:hypothetical protein